MYILIRWTETGVANKFLCGFNLKWVDDMTIVHHTISREPLSNTSTGWSDFEKVSFRFAFIFISLLVIPLSREWYDRLFSLDSLSSFFYAFSGYRVDFFRVSGESGRWGLGGYAAWGLVALTGFLGAAVWTIIGRHSKRQDYNTLYYWLRVIVRYRIGIGLIAFGFIKFFPNQMPFPSIANLNTAMGDYAPFKLYWQIIGVSWEYQSFLGFLEIAIGIMMFFRATTVLGAILTIGVLFNIAHANLGYDGAVHVYSSYFVLLALFLLIQYLPNIWKLFIKGERVKPQYYYLDLTSTKSKAAAYYMLKGAFVFLFVVINGFGMYDRFFHTGRTKEPVIPGLPNSQGYYHVSTFVLNGDTLQYSPHDPHRWHDAIFERYSTFVYKVNKELPVNLGNGGSSIADLFKNYEFTGRAGGKTYLYYEIDSAESKLYLVDKNRKLSSGLQKQFDRENNIDLKELYATPFRDSLGILVWDYERPAEDRLVLSGADANQDSIRVVLDRWDETYLTGIEWHIRNKKYTYP